MRINKAGIDKINKRTASFMRMRECVTIVNRNASYQLCVHDLYNLAYHRRNNAKPNTHFASNTYDYACLRNAIALALFCNCFQHHSHWRIATSNTTKS